MPTTPRRSFATPSPTLTRRTSINRSLKPRKGCLKKSVSVESGLNKYKNDNNNNSPSSFDKKRLGSFEEEGGTSSIFMGANKKVFFDEIMIKEYPIVLGDNPAVYVYIYLIQFAFDCFCALHDWLSRVVRFFMMIYHT